MALPHRLAFLLAMTVLAFSAAGWAAVQWLRASGASGPAFALSPSTAHAVVMVLGFFPLFIAGFIFTAGPRWLLLPSLTASQVAVALWLQGVGWWLWLAGAVASRRVALAGLLCAACGLGATAWLLARLVRRSRAPDRLHATLISGCLGLGALALAGVGGGLLLDEPLWIHAFARSALWGCVVPVFLTASHRMFPALGPVAPRLLRAWGDLWLLWLLLGVSGVEAVAAWILPQAAPPGSYGLLGVAAANLAGGAALSYALLAWVRGQGVKARMTGMLQVGLLWLSIGLLALGVARGAQVFRPVPGAWMTGAMHAVAMGGLGSLMLATVTRVSCTGTGRARVVDAALWTLFGLLQAATVLRVAAAGAGPDRGAWLLAGAASLWAALALAWAGRSARWYGQPAAGPQPRCDTPTLEKPPST